MNKPINPRRITRWLLFLQEFDITIVNKPGKYNVAANILCRLNIIDEDTPVEYIFPDEHIFAISIHNPSYADNANYLAIGKMPHNFPSREQWIII